LKTVLRKPDGEERELELMAKVKEVDRVIQGQFFFYTIGQAVDEAIVRKDRFKELSKDVIV
jgi:hypothetical protein